MKSDPLSPVHDMPNAESTYLVGWDALPLSCPMPDMTLWNSHPRVYLPIHKSGLEKCPYCGAVFILDEPNPEAATPEFANLAIENRYHNEVTRVRAARAKLQYTDRPPGAGCPVDRINLGKIASAIACEEV